MKAFYFKKDSTYDKEKGNESWLYINNFGFYFDIPKDIVTIRTTRRADYHLLYVSEGEIIIDGESLKSGDSYLYFPNEPHKYTYKKTENSRYYWLHFVGREVAHILFRYGVNKGVIRNNWRKMEKDMIFNMLSEEISGCNETASDYATSLFFSLLSLLSPKQKRHRFYKAVSELQKAEGSSITDIATMYNMTPPHFIRSFKSEYGVTPNEYRQNYRIFQAINLLMTTNLSVCVISEQCGFNDQFYFSRIFKKRTGVSPTAYRKTIIKCK